MAIIIPKSKIYNYNFNILQNNYIDRGTLNVKSAYNYEPFIINASNDGLGHWLATSWSDNIYNATINRRPLASSVIHFNYEGDNDGHKTYDTIDMTLQMRSPLELLTTDDMNYLVSKINISIEYNDGTKENQDVSFAFKDNLTISAPTLEAKDFGQFLFDTSFSNLTSSSGYWYSYGIILDRIDKDSGSSTVLVKYAQNVTITITPQIYNNNINYFYTNVNDNYNNYELTESSMMDKNVGFVETGIRIETPLYESIVHNVVDNYQNGKMTMEIETRYTTFEDNEGNEINNGDPYLIKVGDIVKPKMLEKFSAFEYEYVVTSVEYEYDGSDKVYLKLLQVNEE